MFESEKFKQIIQPPKGRKIIRVQVSDDREEVVIYSELQNKVFTQEDLDVLFPVVKASELSLTDSFLTHIPQTENQAELKNKIEEVIKRGIPDFRHSIIDPSVDKDGNIYFKKGELPGIQYSKEWWEISSKEFLPSKNSRLGVESQYYVFLATLLKQLVECEEFESLVKFGLKYFNDQGIFTEDTLRKELISGFWKEICDDSKGIAEYCNTRGGENWARDGLEIKKTGSMPYGIWCDLANTVKVLKADNSEELIFMSGCAYFKGTSAPISKNNSKYIGEDYCYSTGWIVFDV